MVNSTNFKGFLFSVLSRNIEINKIKLGVPHIKSLRKKNLVFKVSAWLMSGNFKISVLQSAREFNE